MESHYNSPAAVCVLSEQFYLLAGDVKNEHVRARSTAR